jgi:hypothetical protein
VAKHNKKYADPFCHVNCAIASGHDKMSCSNGALYEMLSAGKVTRYAWIVAALDKNCGIRFEMKYVSNRSEL